MASQFQRIKTYRSANPGIAQSTGDIWVNLDSARISKAVLLGTFKVNRNEFQLWDLFTAEGRFATTDSEGACYLTFSSLPGCQVA
jgi:hypothetical protein